MTIHLHISEGYLNPGGVEDLRSDKFNQAALHVPAEQLVCLVYIRLSILQSFASIQLEIQTLFIIYSKLFGWRSEIKGGKGNISRPADMKRIITGQRGILIEFIALFLIRRQIHKSINVTYNNC